MLSEAFWRPCGKRCGHNPGSTVTRILIESREVQQLLQWRLWRLLSEPKVETVLGGRCALISLLAGKVQLTLLEAWQLPEEGGAAWKESMQGFQGSLRKRIPTTARVSKWGPVHQGLQDTTRKSYLFIVLVSNWLYCGGTTEVWWRGWLALDVAMTALGDRYEYQG